MRPVSRRVKEVVVVVVVGREMVMRRPRLQEPLRVKPLVMLLEEAGRLRLIRSRPHLLGTLRIAPPPKRPPQRRRRVQ